MNSIQNAHSPPPPQQVSRITIAQHRAENVIEQAHAQKTAKTKGTGKVPVPHDLSLLRNPSSEWLVPAATASFVGILIVHRLSFMSATSPASSSIAAPVSALSRCFMRRPTLN